MQAGVAQDTAMREMATAMRAVTVPPGGVKSMNVFGVRVNLLLAAEDTGGAYATYEAVVEPGGGPPPHVHTLDDEAFLVLEGTFEILRDREVFTAGPGTFVALPRHIPHAFKNVGQGTGRLLGIATPAGHERFFEDADRLAFPPDPQEAIAVCQRHGIELVPPSK